MADLLDSWAAFHQNWPTAYLPSRPTHRPDHATRPNKRRKGRIRTWAEHCRLQGFGCAEPLKSMLSLPFFILIDWYSFVYWCQSSLFYLLISGQRENNGCHAVFDFSLFSNVIYSKKWKKIVKINWRAMLIFVHPSYALTITFTCWTKLAELQVK